MSAKLNEAPLNHLPYVSPEQHWLHEMRHSLYASCSSAIFSLCPCVAEMVEFLKSSAAYTRIYHLESCAVVSSRTDSLCWLVGPTARSLHCRLEVVC